MPENDDISMLKDRQTRTFADFAISKAAKTSFSAAAINRWSSEKI
jgi:hypothetical protein